MIVNYDRDDVKLVVFVENHTFFFVGRGPFFVVVLCRAGS